MAKTTFILTAFTFYVSLFLVLGIIGVESNPDFEEQPGEPGLLSFLSDVQYFFRGIGVTLSSLNAFWNTLIFLPLSITLVWVLVSTLFPGGS